MPSKDWLSDKGSDCGGSVSDGKSVTSAASSYGLHSPGGGGPDEYHDPDLAAKEQKAVFRAKIVLMMVLVIAVAALSSTIYMLITRNEREVFENQVRTFAFHCSTALRTF